MNVWFPENIGKVDIELLSILKHDHLEFMLFYLIEIR